MWGCRQYISHVMMPNVLNYTSLANLRNVSAGATGEWNISQNCQICNVSCLGWTENLSADIKKKPKKENEKKNNISTPSETDMYVSPPTVILIWRYDVSKPALPDSPGWKHAVLVSTECLKRYDHFNSRKRKNKHGSPVLSIASGQHRGSAYDSLP